MDTLSDQNTSKSLQEDYSIKIDKDYIFSGIKKENPIKKDNLNELQDQPNIQKLNKEGDK